MPSDKRQELALGALTGPLTHFRSCLAATVEEIRGQIAANRENGALAGADLGQFGTAHIDFERFAILTSPRRGLDADVALEIQGAAAVLSELVERESALFCTEVAPGGSLRDTVAAALADAGRAFGSARLIERLRSDGEPPEGGAEASKEFPFERWNPAERHIAPPLVVGVRGADLHADELVGFLDGTQKIVLLVDGEAPPAACARLISPGTFVAQATEPEVLDRLGGFDGPGLVAWMEEGVALFTHDPHGGGRLSDRLHVDSLPEQRPHHTVGGRSVRQQLEDLRQLRTLSEEFCEAAGAAAPAASSEAAASEESPAPPGDAAAAPPAAAEPPAQASPTQELARWILSRTDLSDLP